MLQCYYNFNIGYCKPGDYGRYYSSQYWAGAIFTVVSAWIRNGMDADIEQLADEDLAALMFQVAEEMDVKLIWGGNWKTLVDKCHFEL